MVRATSRISLRSARARCAGTAQGCSHHVPARTCKPRYGEDVTGSSRQSEPAGGEARMTSGARDASNHTGGMYESSGNLADPARCVVPRRGIRAGNATAAGDAAKADAAEGDPTE